MYREVLFKLSFRTTVGRDLPFGPTVAILTRPIGLSYVISGVAVMVFRRYVGVACSPRVIYGPLATILYVRAAHAIRIPGIECPRERTGATGTHETLPRATPTAEPLLFITLPLSSRS